jgi:hypothetical protein
MDNLFSLLIFNLECLIILISFLYSIRLPFCKKDVYMKYFALYCLVALIVMIPLFLQDNKLYKMNWADVFNNYSLIFNFGFLGIFILKVLPSNKIYLFLFLVFISLIIYQIVENNGVQNNYKAFYINHIGLITLSFIYLSSIMKDIPERTLIRTPEFWLVLGVLFCSLVNLPVIYLLDQLNNNKMHLVVNNFIIRNLSNFGYIVMYSLFIISFKISIKNG